MKRLLFILVLFFAKCECDSTTTPVPAHETGSLEIIITSPDLSEINIELTGALDEIFYGYNMEMSVSSDNAKDVIYTWYLNGNEIKTGDSCTIGERLQKGVHRVDILAIVYNRAGIKHHIFEIK